MLVEASNTGGHLKAYGISGSGGHVGVNSGRITINGKNVIGDVDAYGIRSATLDENNGAISITVSSKSDEATAAGIKAATTKNTGQIDAVVEGALLAATGHGIEGDIAFNQGDITVEARSDADDANAYGVRGRVDANRGNITSIATAGTNSATTEASAFGLSSTKISNDAGNVVVADNITLNDSIITVHATAGNSSHNASDVSSSTFAYGIYLHAKNEGDDSYGTVQEKLGAINVTARGADFTQEPSSYSISSRTKADGIYANVGTNRAAIDVQAYGSSITNDHDGLLGAEAYAIRGDVEGQPWNAKRKSYCRIH